MLSRQQRSLRRPAHLQAQAGAGQVVYVEPLPEWAICPGAPRMGPIPLPSIPAEQQYGLYTPPASPTLAPQVAPALTPYSPSYGSVSSPSRRSTSSRGSGSSGLSEHTGSLFPDADDDMYADNGHHMNFDMWSGASATPNELWLQRTQQTQNVHGGTAYYPSWMPAPSSSTSFRAAGPAASSASSGAAPSTPGRRVRFAANNETDEDASFGYGHGYGYGNRNGGGGGGGRGYGSAGGAGSKRAWEGRGFGAEDGEDDEEEHEEDDEPVARVRRRGR